MIVVRKCTVLVLSVQVHCTIVLNDRPCCTGICTCEGWLTGGKLGRTKCRGCDHGADMRAVDACLNAAQQGDHTSEHLRKDVVERGGWASELCTCDGACSIVDTILGQGQHLTMKPCRLSEYPRLVIGKRFDGSYCIIGGSSLMQLSRTYEVLQACIQIGSAKESGQTGQPSSDNRILKVARV